MNPRYLANMSEDELEAYANELGFTTRAAAGREAKAALIERRRERGVDVDAIGVSLHLTVKAAHDRRFQELISKRDRDGRDVEDAFRLLLGDEQFGELQQAATDEDGTVDEDALAYAYNRILSCEELKNF